MTVTSSARKAALALAVAAASTLPFGSPAVAAGAPTQDVRQFACPPSEVRSAGFEDTASSPFALEIDCLAAYGVTTGVTPDRYGPTQVVRRGQMAQFLARLATEQRGIALDTSDAGFTDLGGLSQGARDAINGLANAGVLKGRSATAFEPAGPVQRDQLAAFLVGLQAHLGAPFAPADDAFADDDTSVHQDSINRIAGAGIVTGVGDGAYVPARQVDRQQMAAFLMRYVADRIDAGEMTSQYAPGDVAAVPLAGRTVLSGSATGKVAVRLDTPATFTVPGHDLPGSVQVSGPGRLAGLALVADGTDPDRIMLTAGRVSTGIGDSVLASSHSAALTGGTPTWTLPAGSYWLYLIADGAPVTVTLTLDGPPGSTTLTPTVPVSSRIAQPQPRYLPQGSQTGGELGTLTGPGLVLQLTTTLHPLTVAQNLMHCLYLGQNAHTALHAPGCPDADIRLSAQLLNTNTDRVLVYSSAAGHRDVPDDIAQGYSLTNAGLNEHITNTSLWLTL